MTSIERIDANTYGNDVKPAFNIMSYTWGRWKNHAGGPALPVTEITRKVPAALDSHFSVPKFTHAVNGIGVGVWYV